MSAATASTSDQAFTPPRIFAVAHRGASAYAPENTIAAFDEAVALGAQFIEFDVRLTKDGVPVVIHDATLERTTNGQGNVADHCRFDLLRYDAGTWVHPRFAGLRIPTLEETLLAVGPLATPVIELKAPVPPLVLEELLLKYDLIGDSLLISFDHAYLGALRKQNKDFRLGVLAQHWTDNLPKIAKTLAADVLILHTDAVGAARVSTAQSHGLETWCYTPNDPGLVAACAAIGVTGIITDKPDLIRNRQAS